MARRLWLRQGLALVVAAATYGSRTALAALPLLPSMPAEGSARYTVERAGMPLGQAELRWQRQGNRYEIRLATATTGVAALLFSYAEERISRGEVTPQGWWVPHEVLRVRPERPTETLVRQGKEVVVNRKGKRYQYEADANAQDLLSLLFSLPEQVVRGVTSGTVALLGIKGMKALTYRWDGVRPLPEGRGHGEAAAIVAATATGDWQVTAWWAIKPTAQLLQLDVQTEEGAFVYRLLT